ncbi:MAG: signal peptidase I [Sphingomonadales bacterium]|nr:signal peptidase I [Sphingomonadales bacterium]
MQETVKNPADTANEPSTPLDEKAPQVEKDSASEWKDYGKFLLKLALFMFILRSFIISPFNIPSESMQPRLLIGDYLIVSKWNYGYSNYSMAFGLPIIPGHIFAHQPERGDVVVFKAPPTQRDDYIKRVIGLPGDQIQMIDGILYINGNAVKKERIADFVIPVTQNMKDAAALEGQTTACYKESYEEAAPAGGLQCRYPRYRETLPEGKSYNILDIEYKSDADDTQVFIVKEGEVFLMGDNRDRSADSRFPAQEGGGIGLVPQENLIGKAMFSVFSTDGSSSWLLPWTWFTAARGERIGEGF